MRWLRVGAALVLMLLCGVTLVAPGAVAAPVPSKWSTVSAAEVDNISCGVKTSGTLWCWGNIPGARSGATTPVQQGTFSDWSVVSAGRLGCATRTGGQLSCWGLGPVGDGTSSNRLQPTQIGTANWTTVDVGYGAACGIRTSGTLWCWGLNGSGQLGIGSTMTRTSPTQVFCAGCLWTSVSVGRSHACGILTTGALRCWGNNHSGQLGDGSDVDRSTPAPVGSATDWTAVSTGGQHSCGLRNSGRLYCWGFNFYGQLAQDTDDVVQPTPTLSGSARVTYKTISTGDDHSCAIRSAGTLWCWGYWVDDNNDTIAHVSGFTQVGTSTSWVTISDGGPHRCALTTSAFASCWGANGWGGVGDGTRMFRASPTPVL
jgi:hypothetical protein